MIQRAILLFKSKPWAAVLLGIVVVVVSSTAVNSVGYHHADEHYQIIEFANYFLGNVTADQLPWEFKARIRPSVQPLLAAGFIKANGLMGISDPFNVLVLLRLATALFGLWVYINFIKTWLSREEEEQSNALLIITSAMFLWFMPYLLVRFSSENLGSLFFLWAITQYFSVKNRNQLVLFGFLLAMSFVFRFQMGIAIAGLAAWLLIIERINLPKIGIIISGAALGLILLVLSDCLFYSAWVFTPWKYLASNLIEGKAASFGVDPWWFYFEKLWLYLTPIGSILCVIGVFIWIYKFKKSLFLWVLVPFVAVHCLIGHKEFRFLFPIVFIVPLLIYTAFSYFFKWIQPSKIQNTILFFFFTFNVLLAIPLIQAPAGLGRIGLLYKLHKEYPLENVKLIHTNYSNPYEPWEGGNHARYYHTARRNFSTEKIDSLGSLSAYEPEPDQIDYLIFRQMDLDHQGIIVEQLPVALEFIQSTRPTIFESLTSKLDWNDKKEVYYLYRIGQKKEG